MRDSKRRAQLKAAKKRWEAKNREARVEARSRYNASRLGGVPLKFRPGETVETFRIFQDDKCAICKTSVAGELARVDHCHVTGNVRGLLCNNCNLGLGNFRDSLEFLTDAYWYLLGGRAGTH